jgi:hypothetical protein
MTPWHAVALALLLACGTGGAARAQESGGPITTNLRWAAGMADRPVFRGVLNKDNAGTHQGNVMYPGVAGLAGLFVGVLTHAAVSSSVQEAQMKRLQTQADAVLQPYSQALQALSSEELLQLTRAELAQQGLLPGDGRSSLEVLPVFLMTQDRRAVLMDVVAQFNDGISTRTLGMRVVSDPRTLVQDKDDWAAADGSGLRRVSVSLLTRAVRHLLVHFGDTSPVAEPRVERTVRFAEGGAQRMERAAVLEQRCGRALLRTLSETLMSVPLSHMPPAEPGCEGATLAAPPPAAAASAST